MRASWLPQLALCALLFATYGYVVQVPGPNELSRYDLALALVRQRTTIIDSYERNTIDKARLGGHHYTDKAIGSSLLSVPAVAILERLQSLGEYGDYRAEYPVHVATRIAVGLPAALAVLALYRMCRRAGRGEAASVLVAVALGLGSSYWTFATHLYGHASAGAFGLLAADQVFFRQARLRRWLVCGLLAGLAALVEYPAAIVAAVLGALALAASFGHPDSHQHRRSGRLWAAPMAAYVLGVASALSPLPIYAWVSFGSPFAIGYAYVDDPAFAGARQGLFGIGLPTLASAAEVLVGPVGLFTQTPLLLLAMPGLAVWLWSRRATREALATVAISVGFVFANAGYYLPLGGQALGPRFLVPALPFLALAAAWSPRVLLALGAATLPYSVAVAGLATFVYPKAPFPDWHNLTAHWVPAAFAGDLAPNWGSIRLGLNDAASLAPLAAVVGAGVLSAVALLVGAASRLARLAATAGLVGAAGAALALSAPVSFAQPTHPPAYFAQSVSPAAAPSQLRVRFGSELELLGYELGADSVTPGEAVRLDLYWRRLQPIATRYVVYVHAFGRDGAKLGGFDAVPGAGSYPAEMWPITVAVRDTYRVRMPRDARTPSALTLRIGVYESGSMRQLSAVDPAGNAIGPGPALIRLRLGAPVLAVAPAARLVFGGQVGLIAASLSEHDVRPGDEATGSITWSAVRRPERDYTVFVQMLGPSGVVAQWDAQPLAGQYPTGLWLPGEVIEDPFRLAIPLSTPPGEYTVIAGLYDVRSMARLATSDGQDHAVVGRIVVRR